MSNHRKMTLKKNSIYYANMQPLEYNLNKRINSKETKLENKGNTFDKEIRSTIH